MQIEENDLPIDEEDGSLTLYNTGYCAFCSLLYTTHESFSNLDTGRKNLSSASPDILVRHRVTS